MKHPRNGRRLAVCLLAFLVTTCQSESSTVILVHGFLDTSRKMQSMAAYLRTQGWTAYTPALTPSNGSEGLERMAGKLEAYINEKCGPDRRIDLVGFSMGGIVSRYYVQRLGGNRRVAHLVTIASPNHGTLMGYFSGSKAAREMRPGSPFLKALNADLHTLDRLKFTSLWTPLDLMIIPASSSRMPVGKEVRIWMPAHPLMVWNSGCHRAVAAALRE